MSPIKSYTVAYEIDPQNCIWSTYSGRKKSSIITLKPFSDPIQDYIPHMPSLGLLMVFNQKNGFQQLCVKRPEFFTLCLSAYYCICVPPLSHTISFHPQFTYLQFRNVVNSTSVANHILHISSQLTFFSGFAQFVFKLYHCLLLIFIIVCFHLHCFFFNLSFIKAPFKTLT